MPLMSTVAGHSAGATRAGPPGVRTREAVSAAVCVTDTRSAGRPGHGPASGSGRSPTPSPGARPLRRRGPIPLGGSGPSAPLTAPRTRTRGRGRRARRRGGETEGRLAEKVSSTRRGPAGRRQGLRRPGAGSSSARARPPPASGKPWVKGHRAPARAVETLCRPRSGSGATRPRPFPAPAQAGSGPRADVVHHHLVGAHVAPPGQPKPGDRYALAGGRPSPVHQGIVRVEDQALAERAGQGAVLGAQALDGAEGRGGPERRW